MATAIALGSMVWCSIGYEGARADPLPERRADATISPPRTHAKPKGSPWGRVPLGFETNRGQADEAVEFLARARSYHAFLSCGDLILNLPTGPEPSLLERMEPGIDPAGPPFHLVRMRVEKSARPEGRSRELLAGRVNYLRGQDPAKWLTGLRRHGEVHYDDVRPGVDLVYRGDRGRVRFDFVVEPGADPCSIALRFDGARTPTVASDGSLDVGTGHGRLRLSAPRVYQEVDGARTVIDGAFRVRDDGGVTFRIGTYDRARPLVIDPTVEYASYLGGNGADKALGMTLGEDGCLYLCGDTESTDFPITNGAYQTTLNRPGDSGSDTFVTKFTEDGTGLVFSTYYGGSNSELASTIRLDGSGDIYVTGSSFSSDLPLVSAIETTNQRTTSTETSFAAKFDSSGSRLLYSTYINGGYCLAMDIDADGNTYMAQYRPDLHVVKLASDGSRRIFRVPVGRAGGPVGRMYDLDVDADGNVVVCGMTTDTQFPTTTGAYQTQLDGRDEAFVAKFDTDGTRVFSTFLGGQYDDVAWAVAFDDAGNVVVAGTTQSDDFPLANAHDVDHAGSLEAFVSRLNPTGTTLQVSTFYGGTGWETIYDVACVGNGIYFVGTVVREPGFTLPDVNAQDPTWNGEDDVFVGVFSCGDTLAYSSFLGGAADEDAYEILVAPDDDVVVMSRSKSTDMPTTQDALQDGHQGDWDGHVIRFSDVFTPLRILTDELAPWTSGRPGTIQLSHQGGTVDWDLASGTLPNGITLGTDGELTGTPTVSGTFPVTLRITNDCDYEVLRELDVIVNPPPAILPAAGLFWTVGSDTAYDLELSGGTPPLIVTPEDVNDVPTWLSVAPTGRLFGQAPGVETRQFSVRVTDARGASATRSIRVTVNPVPTLRTAPFPSCTTGTRFTQSLELAGGTPPFTWTVVSGTLPTYDDVDADDAELDGFLRPAGTYNFTLRAEDSVGIAVEGTYVVTVNTEPAILSETFPLAAAGRPYSTPSRSAGGTAPIAWTVEGGQRPPGVDIVRETGFWSGVPETGGRFDFQLTARDACGADVKRPLSIDVAEHLFIEKKKVKVDSEVTFLESREPRTYFLELLAGTELTFQLKLKGKSDLAVTPTLLDAREQPIDLTPYLKRKSKAVLVKKVPIPATGRYFLRFETESSFEGKLSLIVKAPPRTSWGGVVTLGASGGTEDVDIAVPPGSTVKIKAKAAKKSGARPAIVGVLADGSTELLDAGVVKTKGKASTWKIKTPVDGSVLRIRIENTSAEGGDVAWSAKLKTPKVNTFELTDVPAGVDVTNE